jgi:hypothetical protein
VAPSWADLWSILLAISVAGIVLAIVGGLVAWRSWRRTREERPGSAHHLLDRGDGRTRFMAMCGILTSVLFLVALVFGTAALSGATMRRVKAHPDWPAPRQRYWRSDCSPAAMAAQTGHFKSTSMELGSL